MADFPIAPAPGTEVGLLLAYTDNQTPGNVGPANVDVGSGGWDQFQFLFTGRNTSGESRIYAVNDQGQLLAYTDNGTPGNISQPVTVGFGGWGQFKFLFAGMNTIYEHHIYAVNQEGQLLSYTDDGTPGNVGPASVTVGADGWDQFKFLFAGRSFNEVQIYAVNQDGNLLAYTDNGTPGNVGHPVTVGAGGWDQFKFLFADALDEPRIYAVNQEGQLLSYTDHGTPGNVSDPVVVGYGAWLEFQYLFTGGNTSGQHVIYAVTAPPPTPIPPPTTASLTLGTPTGPNSVATVLYIEGNNFGPNEAVEVTVVWQVLGESAIYPIDENGQPPKTDLSGYFRLWWSPDINGFCPYPVADGQQQPLQQFNVTAKGVTSGRTASETITLRCP